MKTIAIITLAAVFGIVALCFAADTETTETQNVEATKTEFGLTVKGQVGIRLTDNLCINPTTSQTEMCY